jgi:hypothetical protein
MDGRYAFIYAKSRHISLYFNNLFTLLRKRRDVGGLYRPEKTGADAAIENIDGAGFYYNLVEDVDLVDLSVNDDNHGGDTALQIQKCVKLDCALVLSKDGPGEKRQTDR